MAHVKRSNSENELIEYLTDPTNPGPMLREIASESCCIFSSTRDVMRFYQYGGRNDRPMFGTNSTHSICMLSDDSYEEEPQEAEKSMEHCAIVSKYGLSSKFRCTCLGGKPVYSSTSCVDLREYKKKKPIALRKTKSSFELVDRSQDIDNICMKHRRGLNTLKPYYAACRSYEMFIENLDKDEEFGDIEYWFPLQYTSYWDYICDHVEIYPTFDHMAQERACRVSFIQACRCLIQEEDILRSFVKGHSDIFRTKLDFSGKVHDIPRDFEIAGEYLKANYPYLFTMLVHKNKIPKYSVKKMYIEMNRRWLKTLSRLPHEILLDKNEQCMILDNVRPVEPDYNHNADFDAEYCTW